MSEAKHTSGPWEARTFLVMGGEKMADRICHVGTSTSLGPARSDETVANAILIAAAPKMLAALSHVVESAVILGSNEVVSKEAMDEVRAAIASAEGHAISLPRGENT